MIESDILMTFFKNVILVSKIAYIGKRIIDCVYYKGSYLGAK